MNRHCEPRTTPWAERNREPIAAVLDRHLAGEPARSDAPTPATCGLVLELASGTGEHAAYFARRLPYLRWQPSDPEAESLVSIGAWVRASGLPNLLAPLCLDVREPWPMAQADALVCLNMTHIAPWACTEALMRGAARLLPPRGPLVLYGPFDRDGRHVGEGNARFHAWLRAQNPAWGLRDAARVIAEAEANGLRLDEEVAMPANNLTLVFRRP